jgi:hypothetical protein
MLENEFGGSTSVFNSFGSAGEYTDGCGSSRGRVRGASFYVVGLHIDFGAPYVGNQQFVFNGFVALTKYKFTLLDVAVERAFADRAIKRLDFLVLRTLVKVASALHDRGNYRAALIATRVFQAAAARVRYADVPGKNYSGEHEMRAANLRFTLQEKIIRFTP